MISALERCSVRLYLQLFVGGLMSYLCYLCLFLHLCPICLDYIWVTLRVSYKRQELLTLCEHPRAFGGVRVVHCFSVLCCVFVCLSLSCVLCIQCCKCLWMVHSWFPIRFFLAFIYSSWTSFLFLFICVEYKVAQSTQCSLGACVYVCNQPRHNKYHNCREIDENEHRRF